METNGLGVAWLGWDMIGVRVVGRAGLEYRAWVRCLYISVNHNCCVVPFRGYVI